MSHPDGRIMLYLLTQQFWLRLPEGWLPPRTQAGAGDDKEEEKEQEGGGQGGQDDQGGGVHLLLTA